MNKNIEIPEKIFKFASKYKDLIESENFAELYKKAEKEIEASKEVLKDNSSAVKPAEEKKSVGNTQKAEENLLKAL